jgi:hypothetical protein
MLRYTTEGYRSIRGALLGVCDEPDCEGDPPGVNFLAMILELARLGKTKPIQVLTRATGGSYYPFLKGRGIENAIEKLGTEVHSQYILSFSQRGNAAEIHQIEVLVPNHSDLIIRSRLTYWADQTSDVQ